MSAYHHRRGSQHGSVYQATHSGTQEHGQSGFCGRFGRFDLIHIEKVTGGRND